MCFICHEVTGRPIEFVSHEHGYAHASCLAMAYYRNQATEQFLREERDIWRRRAEAYRTALEHIARAPDLMMDVAQTLHWDMRDWARAALAAAGGGAAPPSQPVPETRQ